EPTWLNDSTLLFVSLQNGQKDIMSIRSSNSDETDIFKSFKHEITNLSQSKDDEHQISVSNDGTKIAYVVSWGKLIVTEIDKDGQLSNTTTLSDTWAPPSGICWSPDDQYLAYSQANLDFNSEIYIQAVDNSHEAVNISMHPRGDVSPSWSADGTKLVFSSIRNHGNYDVWYVWLQKKDWEKTMNEWKIADEKEDKKGKKDQKVEVNIDFENIYQRLYQLTSLPGNESHPLFSKDGKFIYFNSNSNETGKNALYKIKWDKKDIKELTKGGQAGNRMQMSKDGKYIYMVKKGGKAARLKIANDKVENISIKAAADINHLAQNEQVFQEAWKIINQGFYDPDFHGRDWEKLGSMYKPIALKASTDKDFEDIFNWMLGEVNASHMGYRSPKNKAASKEKTALLGIDFQTHDQGIIIKRVLIDSPADKEESKLLINDIITHINGHPLTENDNFYQYLTNQANEPIVLNIIRNNLSKEIIIRPISSVRNQKYNEWVRFNRSLVDEQSKGKLGYLHIKAMGWTSFENFERDLMAAGYGKEGILIDVRYNGGGWTTDYLMAVLTVKQHSYTIPRGASENLEKDHKNFRDHYAFGERLPFAAWTKPSIALCNQNSYSNAEIFSHAYKSNQLGTLVGTPTFGAVISTSGRGLMNGAYIRLPYRGWYVKDTDKNMELVPAVPDVLIDIKPDSRAKGKDEQLEIAVEILLEQIK
ncbi:MAG: PDZ domain-containing protein, partial [Bacteroidales bacterium]|nr:PDZ domain-containing protein [Bacteroidales bacterium]